MLQVTVRLPGLPLEDVVTMGKGNLPQLAVARVSIEAGEAWTNAKNAVIRMHFMLSDVRNLIHLASRLLYVRSIGQMV